MLLLSLHCGTWDVHPVVVPLNTHTPIVQVLMCHSLLCMFPRQYIMIRLLIPILYPILKNCLFLILSLLLALTIHYNLSQTCIVSIIKAWSTRKVYFELPENDSNDTNCSLPQCTHSHACVHACTHPPPTMTQ